MTILLLIVIYVAFIGLGVPDSLIGSAWPAIYSDFGLPVDAVSAVTLLISGSTVLSSIFSAGILNRFGTVKVTAVSTAMTAAALLGFSFAPHFIWMLPMAVILGLGAGAIDAGLNNYIALHYKASHMNFLHCFYGIGVSVSPYIMSLALSDNGWRNGYRTAFFIQLGITLIIVISMPLWKMKSERTSDVIEENEQEAKVLTLRQMASIPAVRTVWVLMMATNAIEYACGTWGSTYLVNSEGFTPEAGAASLTLYYAGMALGRLLSGLLSEKMRTWKRIGAGCIIVFCAVTMLLLPLPGAVSVAGLFFMGLGNGSIYPNLIHLTPHNFGRDVSQSVMGSQIAFAYIGVMIAPPLVGFVTRFFGISVYPILLTALFVIMILSLVIFIKQLKSSGRFDKNI